MGLDLVDIDYDSVKCYNKRDCYTEITDFIRKSRGLSGRVVTLSGLLRTGKTMIMQQLAAEYACNIYRVHPGKTMSDVLEQIETEKNAGKKLVCIDEITNAEDFIYDSAMLADYYTSSGIDVVIAGTDTLGILLAENGELFDRTFMERMTYISFAEHCRVLGTNDIDEYIMYGGLMRKGLTDRKTITDIASVRRYLDSAVAGNIAKSLKNFPENAYFSELPRYSENDLRMIVQKLAELYNGVLMEEVLDAALNTAGITVPIQKALKCAAGIKDRERYNHLNQAEQLSAIRSEYKDEINLNCLLERPVTDKLVGELERAFFDIGLLCAIEKWQFRKERGVWLAPDRKTEYYITQPAIKYCHLVEAKRIFMETPVFNELNERERTLLEFQLQRDIYERMTGNIVIYDTRQVLDSDRYLVCKPYFAAGDRKQGKCLGKCDMLIYDRKEDAYYGFEIKHTENPGIAFEGEGMQKEPDKHFLDQEMKEVLDRQFHERKHICVLYSGNPFCSGDGTAYLNITDFLIILDEYRDVSRAMEHLTRNMFNKPLLYENDF